MTTGKTVLSQRCCGVVLVVFVGYVFGVCGSEVLFYFSVRDVV